MTKLNDIHITKELALNEGSCMFCPTENKGKTYKKVYVIQNLGVKVRVCHHCYDAITKKIEIMKKQ